MTTEVKTETGTAPTPPTAELAVNVVDYFDKYDMTAAEIVAVLEVAKSIVVMDCVATMIAHSVAPGFADQIIGEAQAKAKVTVN